MAVEEWLRDAVERYAALIDVSDTEWRRRKQPATSAPCHAALIDVSDTEWRLSPDQLDEQSMWQQHSLMSAILNGGTGRDRQ